MQNFILDFCNIRGLKANRFSVYCHLKSKNPAILALSETKVVSDADISQYHVPGYSLVPLLSPHRGIALYIRNDVTFTVLRDIPSANPEFNYIWIRFKLHRHIIYFCFLYRSPNMSDDDTVSVFDNISNNIDHLLSVSPSSEIVLAGDFNVHNIPWLRHSSTTSPAGRFVELFCESFNLQQLVDAPTRIPDAAGDRANLLDLFLTSHPDKYSISVGSPLGNSDHCLITAQFTTSNLCRPTSPPTSRLLWHYKNADWESLNQYLREIDWSVCFASRDVDECTLELSNILSLGMREYIPYSYSRSQQQQNRSWFNDKCNLAIQAKESAFRAYQLHPCPELKQVYKTARNTCKSIIQREKFLFDQNVRQRILASRKGSKGFWSLVKTIRNNFSSSSIPSLLNNGEVVVDSLEKANILAARFASNSRLPPTSQTPVLHLPCGCVQEPLHIRTRDVFKVLKGINVSKAAGPDGFSPLLIKSCASSLAKPLRKLFYLSYSTGKFPTAWKLAHVQPIPKKGEGSDPSNYRPIAITSILSKVFESIINSKLMKYLESNKLINDRQYGFRTGRSSGDLLTFLTERWNRSLHNFGESKIVALDISRAFDRVWHPALLAKLKALGLSPPLLLWIESFLSGRLIRVVLDGVTSEPHPINAGVPQGSVISPSLFLIFINDLLSLAFNPIHSFADDSTLDFAYSFDTLADSRGNATSVKRDCMIRSLNNDLDNILAWGKANRVEFNASKSQSCLISLKQDHNFSTPVSFDGAQIYDTPSLCILGINISSKLSWTDHIFSVAKEASKCLGFLKRCKKYFSPSNLALLYKSYIRPRMEYNSHIWAGAGRTALASLDIVQKRAFKLIGDLAITCHIDSLEHRRNVGCLSLLYRYMHGQCSDEISSLIPCRMIPARNTRAANRAHPLTLQNTFGRTVKFRDAFLSRTVRMWNSLPSSVFPQAYNLRKFKSDIHQHLRHSPHLP